MQILHIAEPFELEAGGVLPELHIGYDTYGTFSSIETKVVWVCHALTGNSDAADWWAGLIGPGRLLDPEQYFIVCANNLGSCYGTTGPESRHPKTGEVYQANFPEVTVRDMVRAHQLLAGHLGIDNIYLALGGSMGGQQVLEWAVMEPERLEHIALLASNAAHSPWGIAFNETQRMAILADKTLGTGHPEAGRRGLEAARAIAMLSYRSYEAYALRQSESDPQKIGDYRAASYQRYQGYKLWKRFNPWSYIALSKAMDSHHIGRGRADVPVVLSGVKAKTLVIGISSDLLFPVLEQELLARHIPGARLEVIHSSFGHDGFLVEFEAISALLAALLSSKGTPVVQPHSAPHLPRALPGSEIF
jgi:homoserine O-acetyltransferase